MATGCSVEALVRVHCHILPGLVIQNDLLVGVHEIQFRECLPTSQGREEVVDPGQGVGVEFGHPVHRHLIIPADPYGPIGLDDGD